MPERFTVAERSRVMASIKALNTKPEVIVRKIIHRLGYRFSLHRRDLPGTPDIIMPSVRKIVNVHGCFWHLHTCPHAQREPINNRKYWRQKRQRNSARDKVVKAQLRRMGWDVLEVWECELKQPEKLVIRIARFLQTVKRLR